MERQVAELGPGTKKRPKTTKKQIFWAIISGLVAAWSIVFLLEPLDKGSDHRNATVKRSELPKGPHGLSAAKTLRPALACITAERLSLAEADIERGSSMWKQEYPDCGVLPAGTQVEFSLGENGFSAGLTGTRAVILTAPDRSGSTKAYMFVQTLDHDL